MVMCSECHKAPLEYREINEIEDNRGRDKVLCDNCFKSFYQQIGLFVPN